MRLVWTILEHVHSSSFASDDIARSSDGVKALGNWVFETGDYQPCFMGALS